MITHTADKNPLKHGIEKRFSIKPIFKADKIMQNPPIIIDNIQASSILSYALEEVACLSIVIFVIIHTTATGPIATCGDVPKIE